MTNEEDKIFSIFCRFRPLNENERNVESSEMQTKTKKRNGGVNNSSANETNGGKLVDIVSRNYVEFNRRPYSFDGVFDERCDQRTFYESSIEKMVRQFHARPYDLTIMTYGQTSSGKTWTTDGDLYTKLEENRNFDFVKENDDTRNFGVLPRIIKDVLSAERFEGKKENNESATIEMAFYEIYCERIVDLLRDNLDVSQQDEIKLYENRAEKTIELKGITWRQVVPSRKSSAYNSNNDDDNDDTTTSDEDEENVTMTLKKIFKQLKNAMNGRHYAKTLMNANSSRSHTILDLRITRRTRKRSKHLRIIDLAGSERISKTGSTGKVMREGIKINESLMYLKRMIDAISNANSTTDVTNANTTGEGGEGGVNTSGNVVQPNGGIRIVDYKNTKLTKLLYHSFNGASKVAIILCCSPSHFNLHETISTLEFGTNVKKLKVQLKKITESRENARKALLASIEKRNIEQEEKFKRIMDELEEKERKLREYALKMNEYEISIQELNERLNEYAKEEDDKNDEKKTEKGDEHYYTEESTETTTTEDKESEVEEKNGENMDTKKKRRKTKHREDIKRAEREQRKSRERAHLQKLTEKLVWYKEMYERCQRTITSQDELLRDNRTKMEEMLVEIRFFEKFNERMKRMLLDEEDDFEIDSQDEEDEYENTKKIEQNQYEI